MNYDLGTSNGQNLNNFSIKIQSVMTPREVDDDTSEQMARNAVAQYRSIINELNDEVDLYNDDLSMCNILLSRNLSVFSDTGEISEIIQNSKNYMMENFQLSDGTSPGSKCAEEANLQIEDLITLSGNFNKIVNNQIDVVNNSINVINNNYILDVENRIRALNLMIDGYSFSANKRHGS